MKKHLLLNIAALLSVMTAVLSCSMESFDASNGDHASAPVPMLNKLVINGTAMDKDTGAPLQEIQITMTATEIFDSQEGRIVTKSTYTNNKGQYMIAADGFSRPITCMVKAEDPNGTYKPATPQEVVVSWKGSAYDESASTFFVNGCDFYMEKK